jgi:hypothetical protein
VKEPTVKLILIFVFMVLQLIDIVSRSYSQAAVLFRDFGSR